MNDGLPGIVIFGIVGIVVISLYLLYCGGKQRGAQNRQLRTQSAFGYLIDLAKRRIPIKIICGDVPNITLEEGEDVLCVFPETTLFEPRAIRTWQSNYGGPSFRIAKGVSFRLGASSGVSQSREVIRPIDTGTLILTNGRLFFVGSQRTIDVPLEKIIDVDNEGYSDWLRLNRRGKQKTECFQLNDALIFYFTHHGQRLSAPVHSGMLELAVDQAILFKKYPEVIEEVATDTQAFPLIEGKVVGQEVVTDTQAFTLIEGNVASSSGGWLSRFLLGVAAFFAHPAVRQFFRSVAAVVGRTATQAAMRRMGVSTTHSTRPIGRRSPCVVTSKLDGAEVNPTANLAADINSPATSPEAK